MQSVQMLVQAQHAAQQAAQMAAQAQAQSAAQQQAGGQQQGGQGQDGNQSEPTGFTYRNRARRKASEKPHVRLKPPFAILSKAQLLTELRLHWLCMREFSGHMRTGACCRICVSVR